MVSLEQTLAVILSQIEETRGAGNEEALAALLERKEAVCRMLCALEQS